MITRRYDLLKNTSVKFLVSSLLALTPALANAIAITIEPDDYGIGVPLANAYVTTADLDGYGDDPWASPVRASDPREHYPDYKAPTGNLTFGGAYPFMVPVPDIGRGYVGFGIKFHQEVSHVTLLANSIYTGSHLSAIWKAFDRDGNEIAYGGASAGRDEPVDATFEIDIRQEGIWSLVLGGDTEISAIYFDHLTFELPDASVPAPNPLILVVIGLAMIALRARLKR